MLRVGGRLSPAASCRSSGIFGCAVAAAAKCVDTHHGVRLTEPPAMLSQRLERPGVPGYRHQLSLKLLALLVSDALEPATGPRVKSRIARGRHQHKDLQCVLQVDVLDVDERDVDRRKAAAADGATQHRRWASLRGHPSTVPNICSPAKSVSMPDVASVYHLLAALERGDAARAWEYAASMPRGRVSLDHALALVALSSLHETPIDRYEAAVDRWIERAAMEPPRSQSSVCASYSTGCPTFQR